ESWELAPTVIIASVALSLQTLGVCPVPEKARLGISCTQTLGAQNEDVPLLSLIDMGNLPLPLTWSRLYRSVKISFVRLPCCRVISMSYVKSSRIVLYTSPSFVGLASVTGRTFVMFTKVSALTPSSEKIPAMLILASSGA